MVPPGDERSRALLATATGDVEWGVEANRVQRVLARGDWSAAEPLDVAGLLGRTPEAEGLERVLLVGSSVGTVPLLARGRMRLRDCKERELLAIPSLVWLQPAHEAWIESVWIPEDDCPLLFLDLEVVATMARQHRTSAPDPAPGADLPNTTPASTEENSDG